MDILPTIARLTGAPLPVNPIDGVDIWPMLSGIVDRVDRDIFLYFNDIYPQCARLGPWKMHIARYNVPMFMPEPEAGRQNLPLPRPELYNVVQDPEEGYDRSTRNRAVIIDLQNRTDRLMKTFPTGIYQAYVDAMKRPVENTQVDAPPVAKRPKP